MAIALVANTASQTNSSGTTTGSIDTTGANLLVLVLATYHPQTEAAVSDSKGNTWTGLTAKNDGTDRSRIFYVANPTVGTGHTFTCSQAGSYSAVAVSAWSGAATSSPFDVENGNSSGVTVTSLSTGSVTPSEDGELLVCGGSWGSVGSMGNVTIDNGFSVLNQLNNVFATSLGIAHGYLIQSSAAAVNPTISWVNSSIAAVTIATFKAALATKSLPPYQHSTRILQRKRMAL